MWPPWRRSEGTVAGSTSVRTVVARSCALIPVVTPKRGDASTLTVYAVRYSSGLLSAIGGRSSWSTRSPGSATQINPPARLIMKLISSGVTSCAAQIRSPSFSRSSSSATMTSLPAAMSAMASATVLNVIGSLSGVGSSRHVVRRHELANILAHHVGLHVYGVAGMERAECGVARRMVDEAHLKNPRRRQGVHREAHAVDGDGA